MTTYSVDDAGCTEMICTAIWSGLLSAPKVLAVVEFEIMGLAVMGLITIGAAAPIGIPAIAVPTPAVARSIEDSV